MPNPITPNILLQISLPWSSFFSHFPSFMDCVPRGIFLVIAIIMAMACSAVVTVFPPGVFITATPFFVASSISTLSRPIPALAITLRFVAASRISFVTLVALLMARASYLPMICFNSSGVSPVFTSTSMPSWFSKISIPASPILSLTRTFIIYSPFQRIP